MARARKKKTYRSLDVTSPPEKKQIETKEVVLTLATTNGDVIKIEALEKSGQRRELNDDEFSALAGDDAVDLATAVENAYATGIADALQDDLGEEGDEDETEILRQFILKVAAGRQLLRRGAHKLILRRGLQRQRGVRTAHAGRAGKRAIN